LPFDRVEVHLGAVIVQERDQTWPMTDGMAHRLRQLRRPESGSTCVYSHSCSFDDPSASFLSHRLSMLGEMTADLGLNHPERGDPRGQLGCIWRFGPRMALEEFASGAHSKTPGASTDRHDPRPGT